MWYLHIYFVCDKLLAFLAIFFLLSLYDRLEHPYCIAIGVFCITFADHPHSGWFICHINKKSVSPNAFFNVHNLHRFSSFKWIWNLWKFKILRASFIAKNERWNFKTLTSYLFYNIFLFVSQSINFTFPLLQAQVIISQTMLQFKILKWKIEQSVIFSI